MTTLQNRATTAKCSDREVTSYKLHSCCKFCVRFCVVSWLLSFQVPVEVSDRFASESLRIARSVIRIDSRHLSSGCHAPVGHQTPVGEPKPLHLKPLHLRPFNPPRGVLGPCGPKVGNGVDNEFPGPSGPGIQKVEN